MPALPVAVYYNHYFLHFSFKQENYLERALSEYRLYSLPSEDAEKPFGHVQDGFNALLLDVPVNIRR